MDQDATWQKIGRPRPRPHCIIWGSSGDPAPTAAPPHFGPCLLWPNGRPSQQLLSSCTVCIACVGYYNLRMLCTPLSFAITYFIYTRGGPKSHIFRTTYRCAVFLPNPVCLLDSVARMLWCQGRISGSVQTITANQGLTNSWPRIPTIFCRTADSIIAKQRKVKEKLECGPMPNVMAALPNIGGALCSTPQSLADAHY